MEIDFLNFFLSPESQVYIIGIKVLQTFAIIVLAGLLIKFGTLSIKKFFSRQTRLKYKLDTKKANTLSTLCISLLKYGTYFIAGITILQTVFGIEPTTIVAAAGVGGIAIGFGAQNLVKDVISGFFILLEDQFAVGDIINVDNMFGIVEDMELRITRIRDLNGALHIIPNGEISKVTNHSRGATAALVSVSVAYEENLDKVFDVLNEVSKKSVDEIKELLEEPKVQGVTELGESGITIRLIAKTVAGMHWEVERKLRKMIKDTFDRSGIEIPYNRLVVINPENNISRENN